MTEHCAIGHGIFDGNRVACMLGIVGSIVVGLRESRLLRKLPTRCVFFEFYFMRTCFPQPGWTSSGKVCKAPLSYAGILSSCSMVQPICGYQIVQGPCSAIMRVAEFNADMKRGLEQKCSVQCMHALVFCRFLFAYSCLEKGHAKMLARRTTRLHARRGGWTWVMVSHFRGKLMLNSIGCA